MRRLPTVALFCSSLVGLSSVAGAAQAPAGALRVAPLDHNCRQLANGPRVYAMPDSATSNVAVRVWCRD